MLRTGFFLCASLAVLAGTPALAQKATGADTGAQISFLEPPLVEATPQKIAALKAPAGFTVSKFADNLGNVRVIRIGPNGAVYATRRDTGDIIMLKDANGDGKADGPPVVVARRAGMHGLAFHDGKAFMVTVKEVFVSDVKPDGMFGTPQMIIGDLPESGQHMTRTVNFGPDGMMYITVGSTCNTCDESNPESATVLRVTPDGKSRTIFASGLRDTIGVDWNPKTGELWGMDQGIDFLGDNEAPEELNKIEKGKSYGWPYVYADNKLYPHGQPPGVSREEWLTRSTPMVMGYTPHASSLQMLFYTGGNYPADYQGDAFITFRGSWNRRPSSGYELVRVHFEDGHPTKFEPFVTGFLAADNSSHIARPTGLAMAKDGALLMGDDANGVIYRIAYTGGGPVVASTMPPAEPQRSKTEAANNKPLAKDRMETRSAATASIAISSPDIPASGPIPMMFTSYADNVSPALRWTTVPGAKSYVLLMEDPDAKPVTPTVHWVAFNIAPETPALPQGLGSRLTMSLPVSMEQGKNTMGVVGYRGPKPPAGDPPHHYHFQVFALDKVLDVPAGADRDAVLAATVGHVIGKGEMVGVYQQLVKPPK